jgi:hypothetical protein
VTQGGPADGAPRRDVTRRAYLGVRAPRAPSQRPASRDASCFATSCTRRALSTGPPRVPLRARRSRPLTVLRVKAGVSRRGEGTFSLPTYKTGHPRARREPATPAVQSPTVRSTSYRPVLRHTFPRPPKSYPHCPLPFPGRRLAGARAPAVGVLDWQPTKGSTRNR